MPKKDDRAVVGGEINVVLSMHVLMQLRTRDQRGQQQQQRGTASRHQAVEEISQR